MTHFQMLGEMTVSDVPHIRRLVERMQARVVRDAEDVSRVAMTTHELLENAIKFSTDGTASLRIEVEGGDVCITTRNRAVAADVVALQAIAAQLETSAEDPLAFYLTCMRVSPAAPGGLGFGRVACEGRMQIGVQIEGEWVEVRARSPLAA
jgi:hypothetical protein